jgi:hypothetical protein
MIHSSLLFAAFFIVPGKIILQSIALSLAAAFFNDRKISGSDALNSQNLKVEKEISTKERTQ